MNPKLDSARKELTKAENWIKSCMYQASPSPLIVRSALNAARAACSLIQEVDNEVVGFEKPK